MLWALLGIELGVAQDVAESGKEKKSAIIRLTGRKTFGFFIYLLCLDGVFKHRRLLPFGSVLGMDSTYCNLIIPYILRSKNEGEV